MMLIDGRNDKPYPNIQGTKSVYRYRQVNKGIKAVYMYWQVNKENIILP